MDIQIEEVLGKWKEFTLTTDNGMLVSFLNYGGIITNMIVPDKDGKKENVVLRYADYQDYEKNPFYLGAIIGRVAGRIKQAAFTLDDKAYRVVQNEGEHHLHGGEKSFHNVMWDAETFQTEESVSVTFHYCSPHGHNGYPGNLHVSVIYTLTNENELHIKYEATTDKKTIVTLTNHTYFNLSGHLKETVDHHEVTAASDHILALDKELIPTGELMSVADTPFDLREGKLLQEGFQSIHEQTKLVGSGYDHYFLFTDNSSEKVVVKEAKSGRVMTVKTNQPGMVMYTANAIEPGTLLKGSDSKKYLGVCFETQAPSASLWSDGLPSIELSPTEKYCKETILSFSVES